MALKRPRCTDPNCPSRGSFHAPHRVSPKALADAEFAATAGPLIAATLGFCVFAVIAIGVILWLT